MMVPLTDIQSFPKTSGIYKVMTPDEKVIYIGQSKNIYKRWKNGHHKLLEIQNKYGSNVYIDWVKVPQWLLNRTEHLAISFYKPELNYKTPPIV